MLVCCINTFASCSNQTFNFNRYQFFLQIKRDILQGRLPITFDEAAELFAFAVQGMNS